MKKENYQNTMSAKKFVKWTVCLQSSKCLATGARPAPKFKWTIGDNEILNSNTTNSEELLDEGRGKVKFFQIP